MPMVVPLNHQLQARVKAQEPRVALICPKMSAFKLNCRLITRERLTERAICHRCTKLSQQRLLAAKCISLTTLSTAPALLTMKSTRTWYSSAMKVKVMVSIGTRSVQVFCFLVAMTAGSVCGMSMARINSLMLLIQFSRLTTLTPTLLKMSAGISTTRTSSLQSVTIKSSKFGI